MLRVQTTENYFIYLAITESRKKKKNTEGTFSYNSYARSHLRTKDKLRETGILVMKTPCPRLIAP